MSVTGVGGTGTQSSIDAIIAAYRQTQQQPIQDLQQKQTLLQQRQSFFTSLRTKLDSLVSSISNFTSSNDSLSKFQTKKSTSSDTSVATITASTTAATGINTLKVDRLAANDILVSNRKTGASASGFTAGTKSFDITAGGITKTVSVDFDGTETNESAITKISSAINGTTDIGVTAGYVKDTSTTGRLTLTSKTSGNDNRISFTDTDNVLSQLGITSALTTDTANRTAFTDTGAGFLKTNSGDLDAKFQLNGINILRGSNTVSDAIDGLTISLLKPQAGTDQPVTITTALDASGVASNIKPLLDNYNGVVQLLNNQASTYKSDFAIRSFRSNFRQVANGAVGNGALKYLSDIGVTADSNGQISVTDSTKLQNAVTANASDVAKVFEGFSQKLQATFQGISGDNGLLDSRKTSLTSQIQAVTTRTTEVQKRIDTRADALRKQYESVFSLYVKAQQQFTLIGISPTGA